MSQPPSAMPWRGWLAAVALLAVFVISCVWLNHWIEQCHAKGGHALLFRSGGLCVSDDGRIINAINATWGNK